MKRPAPGFTLVELIVVMAIVGIIAGILSMMLAPAFQNYATVARRADLTHHADTALRRILAEVRTAVPNSLRVRPPAGTEAGCLEMVPTSGGGRYRTDVDTVAGGADPLDLSQPDAGFDVLTRLAPLPAVGDWVVIGNQNTDDVYNGTDREQIAAIAAPPSSTAGLHRITLKAARQFPYGYEGGRFGIVPDSQQAVTYACVNPGVDAAGTGTGTLVRRSHYGFPALQSTCTPAHPTQTVASRVVATKVERCVFIYNPGQGVTQESGFVQLQLTLSDHGESAALTVGAQVENVP